MTNETIFIFIILGMFSVLILQAYERRQMAKDAPPPEYTSKSERKAAILEAFEDDSPHSISQLEQAVSVSRRTVRRYLGELVDEGRVEQLGETGRFVQYRKK